ncbi:hypothetical protein ACU8NH_09335 [Rhizobium leguminosarum]
MTARLIILNTCWAALVVWASVMGYTQFVFTHDISGLSYVISGVLAVSLASIFLGHTRILPHAKTWVVLLGLIGNLTGFVLALKGMGGGDLASAAGLLKMASSLIDGLGVAFCSTLVGAISTLWMGTNSYVLHMEASE